MVENNKNYKNSYGREDPSDEEDFDEYEDSEELDLEQGLILNNQQEKLRTSSNDDEEDEYVDSDFIDIDKGLVLPNKDEDFDEEEIDDEEDNIQNSRFLNADDEDEYVDSDSIDIDKGLVLTKKNKPIKKEEVKKEEVKQVQKQAEVRQVQKQAEVKQVQKQVKVETKKEENISDQKIIDSGSAEKITYSDYFGDNKEKTPTPSTFTPFKESVSSKKEVVEEKQDTSSNKETFKPFVEKFESKKEQPKTFTPFKEEIGGQSSSKSTVKIDDGDSSKEKNSLSKGNYAQVVDENQNVIDISTISDSQLSDMFKKKMLEILFGSAQEEKTIDRIDEDDEPIIDLDNSKNREGQKGRKRIKVLEQANFTYSSDSYGMPKCLPKGFRNTKYSKKTRGLMKVDFSSWLFFICFLLVGGTLFGAYSLYKFAFVPYLGILELSWLNVYTFMALPFAFGFFASILLNDIFKHIIAFLLGYKVLTFKVLGITFYHYGRNTKKIGFRLSDLFSFRHEYIPGNNNINKNPFLIYFLSGFAQLGLFAFLWIRYVSFVDATDSRYVFWADQPQTVFLWMTFFAFIYALIPFIYNYIPIKTRVRNDAYTLFQIRGKNDRTCFNICAVNQKREATGEDFILAPISCNIQNYFQHYAYYYTYLSRLYNEDYKNARKDLHYLRQLIPVIGKKDRHIVDFERSYIRYLYSDPADAEVIFAKVKKGRKIACKPKRLADYRTSIELCANILQESKRIINFIEKLNAFLPYYPNPGKRILKEYQFISYSLKNVQRIIPNIKLPELTPINIGRR